MTDHPQSLTSRVSVWAQVLLSLVVAGFMDGALGASHSRPNILYIFADDMSYRAVGSYPGAHDWVQTPNLDRIAHEGVRFDTCYTGAWCQPARATALTGKLQHGVQWLSKDPPAERTADSYWPVAFRKAGYHTGIIGKWHTGNDKGHGHAWDYSAIWVITRTARSTGATMWTRRSTSTVLPLRRSAAIRRTITPTGLSST